jgi:hypothetical protein
MSANVLRWDGTFALELGSREKVAEWTTSL